MRFLPWLLVALAAPSCVPFVLPPARVEVGSIPADDRGPIQSSTGAPAAAAVPDSDGSAPAVVRAGIHPLQLVPEPAGRRVDVGVGYMMEGGGKGDSAWQRQGTYAEVGVYPFQVELGAGHRVRAGAVALGEYFLHDDRGYRAGLGASAAVELARFTSGAFQSTSATGMMYGEWAIGAFAGPGLRLGDRGEKWAGTFGLSARIPFTLGVLCCITPDAPHPDRASRRNRAEPVRSYQRAHLNRR